MNILKLKAVIKQRDLSIAQVSDMMGINPSTFYRKLNSNGDNFTVSELQVLKNILSIDNDEAITIFFSNKLA